MHPDEFIPDEALVVRGGRPPFRTAPLDEKSKRHPSGFYGFSVKCAVGLTMAELSSGIPHNFVGFTTVGEIRQLGYEVVRTSGFEHHATVIVPEDWDPEAARRLAMLFQEAENPAARLPR